MRLIDKFDRHTDLFQRMSAARHIDLGDAVTTGVIDGQCMRTSVLRCMRCEQTEQCADWLDEAGLGDTPAPTDCRNKLLLDRLSV